MRLQGKVALVTGSGQGIGRAIAVRLAEEGARVVVEDRSDNAAAEETLAQVRQAGSDGCVIAGDIGDVPADARVIEQAVVAMGRLDVLVNNAGIEKRADFLAVTEADFDAVLGVNLRGTFFATQAFARHVQERGGDGAVVNISSVHEELPFPHFASYSASKGAVKMLMRNLAIELAPLGIRVNNIAPGAVQTPINAALLSNRKELDALLGNIPLRRLGRPEDVANAALFLASDEAAYVTGTTLFVDGGLLWNYREQ
ncbi:SDR family NAD(P)-dependent oxidoreductase [Dyella lutea]|uniref:Glucose 1-dehydrogenase n=1 Tax=Dyella lutea TaxID=2950441 RepID=A0ABT1F6C9_9GAMM|nr:glucose 1-dehydrogenase [Dyella lutea]MCP1372934.1 glucose 1-dehydrogenase [Dyella lutea]